MIFWNLSIKTTCKGALNLKKREKNYNTIAQYFIDEIWANQTVMCADFYCWIKKIERKVTRMVKFISLFFVHISHSLVNEWHTFKNIWNDKKMNWVMHEPQKVCFGSIKMMMLPFGYVDDFFWQIKNFAYWHGKNKSMMSCVMNEVTKFKSTSACVIKMLLKWSLSLPFLINIYY